MYQKVRRSGEVNDRRDFVHIQHLLLDSRDGRPRVSFELNRYYRLNPDSQCAGRDFGVESQKCSPALEAPNPLETCRLGEPDCRREPLIRKPCIIRKKGQNLAIDSVKVRPFVHEPNYMRCSGI